MSFPQGDVRIFFAVASLPMDGSPAGNRMPVAAPLTVVHIMQSPSARSPSGRGGHDAAGRAVRGGANAARHGGRGGRGVVRGNGRDRYSSYLDQLRYQDRTMRTRLNILRPTTTGASSTTMTYLRLRL